MKLCWFFLNYFLIIPQIRARIDNILYEKVLHQVQLALKTHTYDIQALKVQFDVLLGKNSKLEAEVITLKNEIKILKGKPLQCKTRKRFTTNNLIMLTAGNSHFDVSSHFGLTFKLKQFASLQF